MITVERGGISFIISSDKVAEWEEKGFTAVKPLPKPKAQPKPKTQAKAQPKKTAAK